MGTLFPKGIPTRKQSERRLQQALPSTGFALRLFSALSPGQTNLVVSPYGARVLLSLLCAGATGETHQEMSGVLGITHLGGYFGKRYEELGHPVLNEAVREERGEEFLTATSIWSDQHFPLNEPFLQVAHSDYHAEVESADFALPSTADAVNAWIREKTRMKITSLVQRMGELSPMFAANAVYFRGKWATPFQESLTREEDFISLDGGRQKVPMMRESREFLYNEENGTQIVELSYSGTACMLVFLPPKGAVLKHWCVEFPEILGPDWRRQLTLRPGEVRLPRFRIESGHSLTGALQAMGMERAFQLDQAEFDGISPVEPLYLGEVRQRGFVEVNEEGTIAAAATYAEMSLSAVPPPPPPPFKMIVDRPFAFAICDHWSGAILFLGTVVSPSVP